MVVGPQEEEGLAVGCSLSSVSASLLTKEEPDADNLVSVSDSPTLSSSSISNAGSKENFLGGSNGSLDSEEMPPTDSATPDGTQGTGGVASSGKDIPPTQQQEGGGVGGLGTLGGVASVDGGGSGISDIAAKSGPHSEGEEGTAGLGMTGNRQHQWGGVQQQGGGVQKQQEMSWWAEAMAETDSLVEDLDEVVVKAESRAISKAQRSKSSPSPSKRGERGT